MSDEGVLAYVLRRPSCGHVTGVCVDDGDKETRKEAAQFCADGIKAGLIVERSTVGAVRATKKDEWCISECPESPNYYLRKGKS